MPATQEELVGALKGVIDPELNVNVVDLGLIYSVQTREEEVDVEMYRRYIEECIRYRDRVRASLMAGA